MIDEHVPVLRCVECGTAAPPGAWKWKAELADDPRNGEPPEVAVYCSACYACEFGGDAK